MHRAASPRRKCAPSGSGSNRGWAMRLRLLTNRSSRSSWKYPQLFLNGLRSRLSTLTALASSEHLPEADTPAPRSVIREEPCDDLSAEAQRAKAEAIRTASPAGLLRFA